MLKIRIRTKLAAALAVPLVGLVAISGFEAVQASEDADRVRSETELALVSVGPSSLTTELQNERNYSALDLIGLADAATLEVASVAEARQRVDATAEQLRDHLSAKGVAGDSFDAAFAALESDLEDTRELWDDHDGDKDLENQPLADEVFERFTTMTEAFFDATESVATAVDDNALRNGIEIVDNSNRRGELLANITRLVVLDHLTDGGEDLYRSEVSARLARLDATEDRIEQLSVGPYSDVADATLGRDFDVDTREHFVSYLAGEDVDLTGLLEAVSAGGADGVVSSAEMASDILEAEASQLTTAADERKEQFLALAAGIVALAIVSSWLASRSITRPLRRLRAAAAEMATDRLPAALQAILETPPGDDVVVPDLDRIVVRTRDEVREVVDVLNDVQDRTLALAADQAVLRRNISDSFVNLGRRNQNLLDRQLEFITELEQNETEPEALESLFRLDHLATRMRRNAESLLVLAGAESPRQWAAPVDVDDVIRAALGEVEDYQRVSIRQLEPATVAGSAAAGASHVLAELFENALQYSPPGCAVQVKGRHNADGYVIAIDDDGIGMGEEDLARANSRLAGTESYTVAPSRYLGHYVAGNLASRLGIVVRLQDSPAGGVTATVGIPSSLIDVGAQDNEIQAEHPAPGAAPEMTVADPAGSTEIASDDVDAPRSLVEALGASELASIESVQDLTRAIDGGPGSPLADDTSRADEAPTASGLPKRIPGAQRPDLQPTVVRRRASDRSPTEGTQRDPHEAEIPAADDADPPAGSAGVFGYLAGYSAAAHSSAEPGAHLDTTTPTTSTDEHEAFGQEDQEER